MANQVPRGKVVMTDQVLTVRLDRYVPLGVDWWSKALN